jgi:SAM-dependent methyltransferase
LGRALLDYHQGDTSAQITVESNLWENELTPVEEFYRPEAVALPEIEWRALRLCRGRVLDLGAGAGRHAVELQKLGFDVTAVDILPEAVAIMKDRGVTDARHGDLGAVSGDHFDTILLLMHGVGLVGTLEGLAEFLDRVQGILGTGGRIIFDSANLGAVLPSREEEHRSRVDGTDRYFGEVTFRLNYNGWQGAAYPWLFLDSKTLAARSKRSGFCMTVAVQGSRGAYLARLERK